MKCNQRIPIISHQRRPLLLDERDFLRQARTMSTSERAQLITSIMTCRIWALASSVSEFSLTQALSFVTTARRAAPPNYDHSTVALHRSLTWDDATMERRQRHLTSACKSKHRRRPDTTSGASSGETGDHRDEVRQVIDRRSPHRSSGMDFPPDLVAHQSPTPSFSSTNRYDVRVHEIGATDIIVPRSVEQLHPSIHTFHPLAPQAPASTPLTSSGSHDPTAPPPFPTAGLLFV